MIAKEGGNGAVACMQCHEKVENDMHCAIIWMKYKDIMTYN